MDKIAVICLKYPPIYSGYGNQAYVLFNRIIEKNENLSFTILTDHKDSLSNSSVNIEVKSVGKEILRKLGSRINVLFYGMRCFSWLLFNSKKYSAIHCISAYGPWAVPATIAALFTKKKIIIKITQGEFRRNLNKVNIASQLNQKIRKKVVSKADYFISISEEIKQELILYGINEKKIVSIPNGVDEKKYYPVQLYKKRELKSELKISRNSIVILYAGALVERKGVKDLLKALTILDDVNGYEVEMIFCGPDPEQIFEEYIYDSKFPIKVSYHGEINDLSKYYQIADIFILPSYSEGLPNVLLEASMSRLAIICSDIGGNRDIVENGFSGLLFPAGDVKALKERISSLVKDEKVRNYYAENTYNNAKENFSLKFVSEEYTELYENLLTN